MKHLLRWLPVPAALLAALVAWWVQLQALGAHRLQWAHDVAFFNQIFHAAADGRAWTSSLLIEPTGFFEMVHFHPIIAALLPAYLIAPGPGTLLLFNALAVCATAIPLARLAAAISGREGFGLAAALAFLVWMPTWSAAMADFRPLELMAPGLALAVWGAWERRWGVLIAGAGLCCASREEASYFLVGLGGVMAVLPVAGFKLRSDEAGGSGWRSREGLALLLLGLAWFGFLVAFKGNFFFHFDPRVWLEGLSDGGRPEVDPALLADRWRYGRESFLGGYLLALLAPAALVASLPPAFFLWTDAQREWHSMAGLYVHLRAPMMALWAVAGTAGAAWLAARYPKRVWVIAAGLVLGNAVSFRPERAWVAQYVQGLSADAASPEVAALDGLIARVDAEDRVATDYKLIAALSGRRVLWNTAHLYAEDGTPPWWTAEWPLTLDRVDTLLVPDNDHVLGRLDDAWALEAEAQGYQLWRRTAEPDGGFPEPLP